MAHEWVLKHSYAFSEGSGDTIADGTGSVNLTRRGTTKPAWTTGRNGGGAIQFTSGSDQFLSQSTQWTSSNQTDNYVYNWAVKIWFKATNADGRKLWGTEYTESTYCSSSGFTNYYIDYFIYLGTDGTLHAYWFLPGISNQTESNANRLDSGINILDGEWHEVLFINCRQYIDPLTDISYHKLYLDGVLRDETATLNQTHSSGSRHVRVGGSQIYHGSSPSYIYAMDYSTRGCGGAGAIIDDIKYFWVDGGAYSGECVSPINIIEWRAPQPNNSLMFSCNT